MNLTIGSILILFFCALNCAPKPNIFIDLP